MSENSDQDADQAPADAQSEMQRRLSENRRRNLLRDREQWLSGRGDDIIRAVQDIVGAVGPLELLAVDETDALFARFHERIQGSAGETTPWREPEMSTLFARLAEFALPEDLEGALLYYPHPHVVGIVVSVRAVLAHAREVWDMLRDEIRLCTRDAASGIYLEWNYIGRDREFELHTWGRFSGAGAREDRTP